MWHYYYRGEFRESFVDSRESFIIVLLRSSVRVVKSSYAAVS